MMSLARHLPRKPCVMIGCAAFCAIAAVAMLWLSGNSAAQQQPELAAVGSVLQSDAIVGMGFGAKFDPTDPTRLRFAEITNADNFDFRRNFEFHKYLLKVQRVHEVRDVPEAGPPAAAAHNGRILVGVVAIVIWKRD